MERLWAVMAGHSVRGTGSRVLEVAGCGGCAGPSPLRGGKVVAKPDRSVVVQTGERGMSVPRVFRDDSHEIHLPRSPNDTTNPTDRGKPGPKRSVLVNERGGHSPP